MAGQISQRHRHAFVRQADGLQDLPFGKDLSAPGKKPQMPSAVRKDQLRQGRFDLCLTTGVLDADRFVKKVLLREPVMLCIPREHELYEKKAVGMEDLDGRHFAMFSTQFFMRHTFDALCGEAGIEPVIEYISNDFNSLLGLAQQYGLLFAVPLHCVGSLGRSAAIRRFPTAGSSGTYAWSESGIRS